MLQKAKPIILGAAKTVDEKDDLTERLQSRLVAQANVQAEKLAGLGSGQGVEELNRLVDVAVSRDMK